MSLFRRPVPGSQSMLHKLSLKSWSAACCMLVALCWPSPVDAQVDPVAWKGPAPVSPRDFRRVTLASGLNLPMQFDEAADGRIFILQQTGQVILYEPGGASGEPAKGSWSVCGSLTVDHRNEQGGLGLALDPDFASNGWIYVSYTPTAKLQKVSRFTFQAASRTLDPASEKILLQIPMAYAAHCAGALMFGKEGNLYVSTGANNQGAGAPSPWLTSADTRDMRGKILRIRPTAGGGYAIPEGNLLAGNPAVLPEIYSMGHRNPFRFGIDLRSGYLYVAEVGDMWEELNQVREPGNFGYPQYEGNQGGVMTNPAAGNTGLSQLPASRPTWITYQTADPTRSVPQIAGFTRGGGASIMAGPVYQYADEAPRHGGLPSFYHGRLFWFDFNKGMIFGTRIGTAGEPAETTEAFAGLGFAPTRPALVGDSIVRAGGENTGLIDMKIGRYGNPLMLEYFSGSLYRIEYTGAYPVSLAGGMRSRARTYIDFSGGGIRMCYRADGRTAGKGKEAEYARGN